LNSSAADVPNADAQKPGFPEPNIRIPQGAEVEFSASPSSDDIPPEHAACEWNYPKFKAFAGN
jgi:hypothetical protein